MKRNLPKIFLRSFENVPPVVCRVCSVSLPASPAGLSVRHVGWADTHDVVPRAVSTPTLHVFGPNFFFGGGPQKFWDLDYKIEQTSDHVAMFHGDRPAELGDLAVKKSKEITSAVKHKTPGNYRSGRPNRIHAVRGKKDVA